MNDQDVRDAVRIICTAGALLLIVLLFLFVLGRPAHAAGFDSDDVTWTAPTLYDDGSAIAAGELTEYVLRWGTQPGGPYPNEVRVPASQTGVTVLRVAPYSGRRCYIVAAVAQYEGLPSAEVCKIVKRARAFVIQIK